MKRFTVLIPEVERAYPFRWVSSFANKDISAYFTDSDRIVLTVDIADDGDFTCPGAVSIPYVEPELPPQPEDPLAQMQRTILELQEKIALLEGV